MMMKIWEYGSHWYDITVTNLVCTIVCLPLAHTYTLQLSFCKMFRFAISSKNVCLSAKFLFPRWKFVHTIKFSVQLVVFLLFTDETHKILHWNTMLGNQTQTRQKKNCGKKRSERLEKKTHREEKKIRNWNWWYQKQVGMQFGFYEFCRKFWSARTNECINF